MSDDLEPQTEAPADRVQRRRRYVRKPPRHVLEEALSHSAGLIAPAARALGVSRMTLYRWLERDQPIIEHLGSLREEFLDMCEAQLVRHVHEGSERSVHFALRTLGKNRGYSERQEVTGANGDK